MRGKPCKTGKMSAVILSDRGTTMQVTINVKKAAEFAAFNDAAVAGDVFEARHGIDTRIVGCPDGYLVQAIDQDGDGYGWLEDGTIDITMAELVRFKRS